MIDTVTDTLAGRGSEFQSKVLALMSKDLEFLGQICDAVDPKYFESMKRQWIASVILDHFNQYRELPTALVFNNEHSKITDKILKVTVGEEIKAIIKHVSAKDLKYIKNEFLKFCEEQSIKNGLGQAIDLVSRRQFHEAVDAFRKSATAVAPRDLGHEWKSGWEERLKKNVRDCIPTPWECMNEIMGGGLAKTELGLVAGPQGSGKSWLLVHLAAAAMRHGKNVLYITTELGDKVVSQRLDTVISGIPLYELKEKANEAVKMFDQVSGTSYVKWYANGAINAEHIMALVHQHGSRGNVFDMLIVDPPDYMHSVRKTDARHHELKTIYSEIRGVAGELLIPCWVASQVQRGALEEEVIYMQHIAESIGKFDVADFGFTWARTTTMKAEGKANAHIVKNRNGPDAIILPAIVDPPMGILEIFNNNASGGLGISTQAHRANLVAQQLSRGRDINEQRLAKKEAEEAEETVANSE